MLGPNVCIKQPTDGGERNTDRLQYNPLQHAPASRGDAVHDAIVPGTLALHRPPPFVVAYKTTGDPTGEQTEPPAFQRRTRSAGHHAERIARKKDGRSSGNPAEFAKYSRLRWKLGKSHAGFPAGGRLFWPR